MDQLILLVGFVLLLKGADLLVQGSASLAARLGVSSLVIGLTVVSFGTSMPEMLVTLVSGLQRNADLAVANVIGSNIANVLLVLGIAAAIRPLPVRDSTVVSEIPFSLTAALLVGFLANAALFSPYRELSISRLDGAILLFFFFMFLLYVYKVSRSFGPSVERAFDRSRVTRSLAKIALGVVALYFGGRWVVDGAVGLAQQWGVDDSLIGLTIVAVGTSSPEIIASAVAAYRNVPGIAVGNVVGSNIFNLLWVLGLTSSIVELPFEVISNTDLVMVIAASALLILALVSSRNKTIMRWHGILFVLLYFVYVADAIRRNSPS
jgi:cation:H+ antiporter